jgi:DNA-binding MarR family transcriptional regulator
MDLFDEAACAALGVGRSDLRALNLLEHGPLTASALAQQLHLTRPAVTALVDRLVAAGLVERTPVAADRRATAVTLMPATWQAFARVYRPLGDRVRAAVTALPSDDQAALGTGLDALGAAFREARAHLAELPQAPER